MDYIRKFLENSTGNAIVHLTAESKPFFKRGGLGDMVECLARFLSDQGKANVIILPYYSKIDSKPQFIYSDNVAYGNEFITFSIYAQLVNKILFMFIKIDDSYLLDQIYDNVNIPYETEVNRYHFILGKIISMVLKKYFSKSIIFTHDWHIAAIYFYIFDFNEITKYHVIHNYNYQGEIFEDMIEMLEPGIRRFILSTYRKYNFSSLSITAIEAADKIITVSPSYANELEKQADLNQYAKVFKNKKLLGILNGIDSEFWNPFNSQYLVKQYNHKTIEGKKINKEYLIKKYELKIPIKRPIALMLSRLAPQKGINMFVNILDEEQFDIIENFEKISKLDLFIIVCGVPHDGVDGSIDLQFKELESKFKGNFIYINKYTEDLAHQLLAGSDFLIHPSEFEPCGLTQLHALSFGTIPLVSPVGGLKDTTICELKNPNRGNSFWLKNEKNRETFYNTLKLMSQYYKDKKKWRSMMIRAMKQDNSYQMRFQPYLSLLNEAE